MPDNFVGDFLFNVSGADNNNLADPGQGVCAVTLSFEHEYIGDLSITLTSPSGQSVTLVGPIGLFGETDFTTWNITFVPCGDMPNPDAGFSPVWNNNQAWGLFGDYIGTYHPQSGCLENFNTGPVDGTWTLHVVDGQANDVGTFFNYEIIFCDPSGIDCVVCAANAGNLTQPDVAACQYSPSLNLTLPPTYTPPNVAPPANIYSYTYAIAQGGILIEYDPDANLSDNDAGTYTVCGVSYTTTQEGQLPQPNGSLTMAQLATQLNGPNPPLCARLTNNCVNVIIHPLTDNEEEEQTICWNQCYVFHQQNYCNTGIFVLNLVDNNNCPFTATLDLTERPNNVKSISETICEGDCSANPGFPTACEAGTYQEVFDDYLGCDSTVNLTINVLTVVANIQPPATLGCVPPTITLSSTGSTTGSGVTYLWAGPGIVGPATNPACTVNEEGTYSLVVKRTVAGKTCTDSTTVDVISNAEIPQPPGSLSGIFVVCPGQILPYVAGQSQGATSYQWTLPGGAAIQGNQSGLQVTIVWGNQPGLLCVAAANACGVSDTICHPIQISTAPAAPAISGPAIVCANATENYSMPNLPGTTAWNWTVPAGATIVAGNATSSVSINWGNSAGGQVCGTVTNECGTSQPGCLPVTVSAGPIAAVVSGNSTACGASSENYSVPNQAGATFTWSVSSGGQITAGQGTSQISVAWNAGISSGTVCCTAQNPCGTTPQNCFSVSLNNAPVSPDLTGLPTICQNQTGQYSIDPIAGATNYSWTVPSGATILSGAGTTSISVNWTGSTGGPVVVSALNNCGMSIGDSLVVQANLVPSPSVGIDGQTCGLTFNLSGNQSVAGSQANWSLSNGAGAAGFSNPTSFSTQVTVNQYGSYTFHLTETNAGCLNSDSLIVVFRPSPTAGQLTTTCDAANENYVVSFPISGGQSPFLVNGQPVGGGVFSSNPIVGGQPFSFVISDVFGCESQAITGIFNCNCLTKAGTMSLVKLEACEGQSVQAVAPTNAVLDGNDIAVFVLHNNAGITLGQIFGQNTTGLFGIQPGMNFGDTYYISYFVGNNVNGSPDPADGCKSVAQGTPVVFHKNPTANAGIDRDTCGLAMGLNAQPSVGFGTWSVMNQPPGANLVFGDSQNPNSTINASLSGTYTLVWTENNNGCTAQNSAFVEFNEKPTAGLPLLICDGTGLLYTVGFDILNGQLPYSVNGLVILGSTFLSANQPTGANYSFQIEDANGCPAPLISGKKNCNCLSAAGQMNSQPLLVCEDGTAQANHLGGQIADANDATAFVLHDIGGASLGQILTQNTTGQFQFLPGLMQFGQAYFISFVVGNDSLGQPNLNDDCLAVAAGQMVTFYENPTAEAGIDQQICGQSTDLEAVASNFNGIWTMMNGSGVAIFSNQNSPASSVSVSLPGIYQFLWTVDNTGLCTASDDVQIEFAPGPVASPAVKNCDATNTVFQLEFSISGGTPPYSINGLTGQLVGNQFISDDLSSGTAYSFVVEDALGCVSQLVSGIGDCLCETAAGQMAAPVLSVCEGATAIGNHLGGQFLDGNDTLVFVLHDGAGGTLGSIFSMNKVPEFDWQPTLVFGQTYQISAVATSILAGGGVDFNDACREVSNGQPVVFHPSPTVVLTGDAMICAGESTSLNFSCTGDAPFSVQWSDGVQNFTQNVGAAGFQKIVTPTATTTYSLILVSDSNSPACQTTSNQTVLVEVGQPAAATVLTKLEVCNNPLFGSLVNFSSLVTGGDMSGNWTDLSGSGAAGSLPILDFQGLSAGVYLFEYSTAAAQAPCLNRQYQVEITVNDCDCPSVMTVTPAPLCNGSGSLDLGSITLTSVAGSWSITSSPSGAGSPAEIIGNTFVAAGAIAGLYSLTFTLDAVPPVGCPAFSMQNLSVAPAVNAGKSGKTERCAGETWEINLFSLLTDGPSTGGNWTEISNQPSTGGAFQAATGLFETENQAPGIYTFKYGVTGVAPCPSGEATATVEIWPNPLASAGADLILDCFTGVSQIAGSGSTTIAGSSPVFSWKKDGLPVLLATNSNLPVNQPGIYELTVLAQPAGCKSTDEVVVIDAPKPTGAAIVLQKIACFGEKTGQIQVNSVDGGTAPFLFSFNGGAFSTTDSWQKLGAGFYELKIQDAFGCEYSDTLEVIEPPKLEVELGPDLTVALGDSAHVFAAVMPLQAAIEFVNWSEILNPADSGQLSQHFLTYQSQVLHVNLQDTSGCRASDFVRVLIDKTRHVYVPNAFSPDSDDNNLFLIFGGQDVLSIRSLLVYDRWGEPVFEGHDLVPGDISGGWDGSWKEEKLGPAVFVWWAEIEFIDGEKKIYKGDVLLTR